MPEQITFSVVGLRYRVTPATLRQISKITPVKARLKREPENSHDENAVAVLLMEKPWRNFQIGYLPRETASVVAPRMDAKKFTATEVWLTELDEAGGVGEVLVKYKKGEKLA